MSFKLASQSRALKQLPSSSSSELETHKCFSLGFGSISAVLYLGHVSLFAFSFARTRRVVNC